MVNEFILRTQEKPEPSNGFYVTADGVSRFISQLISGHDQHAFISRVIDRNAPKHLNAFGNISEEWKLFRSGGANGRRNPRSVHIYINAENWPRYHFLPVSP